MNLNETIRSLFGLYGLRNAMFLRGEMRTALLHRGIKTLSQAIRKGEDKEQLTKILASVFARSVAFADSFVRIPLVEALSMKYPIRSCAYCGKSPCKCGSVRKDEVTLQEVSPMQMGWTITDWVTHLDILYGASNRKRGIHAAINRLTEEMHEVESAHLFDGVGNGVMTLSQRREQVAQEFADLFAWIFSIAGMLDLPLQKVVEERYGGNCKRCGKRPCDCSSIFHYGDRADPIGPDASSV